MSALTTVVAASDFVMADRFLRDAAADPRVGDGDFRLLFAVISHHSHKSGRCYPSKARLAERSNRNRRNVLHGLKRLVAAKLLSWIPGAGSRGTHAYVVNWDHYGSGEARSADPVPIAPPADVVVPESSRQDAAQRSPSGVAEAPARPARSDVEPPSFGDRRPVHPSKPVPRAAARLRIVADLKRCKPGFADAAHAAMGADSALAEAAIAAEVARSGGGVQVLLRRLR